MKLKNGFITHEMDGEQVLVSTGIVKFAGMARSNKTAAFIVDCLKKDTTRDAIIAAMLQKYDATEQVIAGDVDMILGKLRSIGALDE